MKGSPAVPVVRVVSGDESLVSWSGVALLAGTATVSGLTRGLCEQLAPWRAGRAIHDPGKIVFDLAVAVAMGGDALADVGMLRAQPGLCGPVASDPTVSRLLEALAADPQAAIAAIRRARAQAREAVWARRSPVPATGQVIVDLDATLVGAHSDKEQATPTYKRGFGFHPMLAFVDHAPTDASAGTGEPLAALLRPGNANANNGADQIAVLDAALAQLPEHTRHRVLVRGDAGSGVKAVLAHVHELGLQFTVGMNIKAPIQAAIAALPASAWTQALNADGDPRESAQVAEVTAWLPAAFTGWPPGTRVIVRRELAHPGAQLRITDHDGWRLTAFATNTTDWPLVDLEVRHRLRARAEDRIRNLKDTGLANLPLHAFDKNQIWLEIAQLAAELLTWTQLLALHDQPARAWEPKRLRLRLLAVAGRLVRTARRTTLRIDRRWPWAALITRGHANLTAPT